MKTPYTLRNSCSPTIRIAGVLALALHGVLSNDACGLAQTDPQPSEAVRLTEALVIESIGRYGRHPIHLDAIEHAMAQGTWTTPELDDVIHAPDGTPRTWHTLAVNAEGWLQDDALRGGYACWAVSVSSDQIMILHALGHFAVCVNGEWRAGDPYQNGWMQLPIQLHEGDNELLFHVGRGSLRAELRMPRSPIELNTAEATLPTLVVGEVAETFGSVTVINASNEWLREVPRHVSCEGLGVSAWGGGFVTNSPAILPLSIRKLSFSIDGPSPEQPGVHEATFSIRDELDEPCTSTTLPLRVVTPNDAITRTFISAIDGSVQYYAVRLATDEPDSPALKALILTLHGAGVEAAHQASCYSPKSWAHIVAPTNRRPFGFDWEDWGRLDALEVLDLAIDALNADARRVAVTGHSMGGHGTWHLAVNHPDKFVAAAPSAGWPSFWTYTGAAELDLDNPIEAMLHRATAPSHTLEHIQNLNHMGVYILHGDKDDNVPIEQARIMRRALADFHPDFAYHEQPGAGHWWGNECMDYPPLMRFLEERLAENAPRKERNESKTGAHCERTRPGPFKDAFRNNFMFVIGTQGTPEENAAAFNMARFHAETFWYRGNGSIDIVLDTEFDSERTANRNIILYGNADTNSVWPALLNNSPIQVQRGKLTVGDRALEGDDLACIMIRPRPGPARDRHRFEDDDFTVGVFAATGVKGQKAAMRLPVFVSGVAYPDFMIWSSDALLQGTSAIKCTGFFSDNWSITPTETAWNE